MSEEILRERATIEIEGVRYTLRRPGIRDCFTLPRILAAIQIHAGHNVEDFYEPVPMVDEQGDPVLDKKGEQKTDHHINVVALLFSMASGIPEAEDPLTEWLASVLIKPNGDAITVEELQDSDTFPLEELPPLIEKLAAMPSFPTFFERSVHASKAIRELWPSKSGKSKDQQDGQTNKSAPSHTQGSRKSQRPRHEDPSNENEES